MVFDRKILKKNSRGTKHKIQQNKKESVEMVVIMAAITITRFFFIRTKFIRTIRLKFGQKLRTS